MAESKEMERLTDKNSSFAEKETLEMFRQEREHWQEFCLRIGRFENKLKEYEDLGSVEEFKQALTELQQIKSAEPTKALECLEEIKRYAKSDIESIPLSYKDFCIKKNKEIDELVDTIKQALLKAQELEKENAYIEKVKTMLKQKDCVLRYVESEDCFIVKTMLSGWYKLTPQFVDNNVREEIKPLPTIEKIKQLKEGNAELKRVLGVIISKNVDIMLLKKSKDVYDYNSVLGNSLGDCTCPVKLTEAEFEMIKREVGKCQK